MYCVLCVLTRTSLSSSPPSSPSSCRADTRLAQLNRDVSEALREKQGVEVELQQTQTTLQTVEVKLNALQDEAQSTIRGLMKELKATEDAHTTERRRLRKDLDNAIDVSEQHKREKDRLHDNQGRAVEALETDMEQQVNRLTGK